MSLFSMAGVALWGAAGICLRWWIQLVWMRLAPWPGFWATCGINVVGSFLIGMVVAAEQGALLSQDLRTMLTVGFLGGVTTFSAFSLEAWQLLAQGEWGHGMLYLVLSPVSGVLAAAAGMALTRAVIG